VVVSRRRGCCSASVVVRAGAVKGSRSASATRSASRTVTACRGSAAWSPSGRPSAGPRSACHTPAPVAAMLGGGSHRRRGAHRPDCRRRRPSPGRSRCACGRERGGGWASRSAMVRWQSGRTSCDRIRRGSQCRRSQCRRLPGQYPRSTGRDGAAATCGRPMTAANVSAPIDGIAAVVVAKWRQRVAGIVRSHRGITSRNRASPRLEWVLTEPTEHPSTSAVWASVRSPR
jgi:hypothetical protein